MSSSKFYRKVHMLPTIGDVEQYLKLDDTYIPKPVVEWVKHTKCCHGDDVIVFCSHDKSLLSRHQSYAVAPPAGQDKPKGSDEAKGDSEKHNSEDDDKLQDITAMTPAVTSDNWTIHLDIK